MITRRHFAGLVVVKRVAMITRIHEAVMMAKKRGEILMIYRQQLELLAKRFRLSEHETFLLDMHIHLTALQLNMFNFQVAARLIDISIEEYKGEKSIMDNGPEQETVNIDRLIALITQAHNMGKKLAEQIARGVGGRETALTLTHLEEARHFARDAKELLDTEEPIGEE